MRIWISITLLSCLVLTACARIPRQATSYVSSKVTPAEIDTVTADAARHLYSALPPAQTTLLLAPVKSRAATDLSTVLAEQLRVIGYGVIESDHSQARMDDPHVVLVRYLVSRLDDGVMLQLQYRNIEANRFYPRTTGGGLALATPFAVREAP